MSIVGKDEKFIDLHLHTYFSDGTFSPGEIVDLAVKRDLAAIGITDHDSVKGIKEAIDASEKYQIEVVPGLELTAEFDDKEIHILGYYVNWQDKIFCDTLAMLRDARRERAKKMVGKLKELGIEVSFEAVEKLAGKGALGRLHLAQVMLKSGCVNSLDEVFRQYIGNGGPAYVKKHRLTPAETVKLITDAGGIPVLAHPYLLGKDDSLIARLVDSGIKGIEVYYINHSPAISARYEEIAYQYNLVPTGGSDCHGLAKEEVLIGKVKVPYSCLEQLKEAVK